MLSTGTEHCTCATWVEWPLFSGRHLLQMLWGLHSNAQHLTFSICWFNFPQPHLSQPTELPMGTRQGVPVLSWEHPPANVMQLPHPSLTEVPTGLTSRNPYDNFWGWRYQKFNSRPCACWVGTVALSYIPSPIICFKHSSVSCLLHLVSLLHFPTCAA